MVALRPCPWQSALAELALRRECACHVPSQADEAPGSAAFSGKYCVSSHSHAAVRVALRWFQTEVGLRRSEMPAIALAP